ncbi:unnamed protein product, partial [marine sediment metagenome]
YQSLRLVIGTQADTPAHIFGALPAINRAV